MKKTLAISLALAAVVTAMPAGAAGKKPHQHVDGSIALPTPVVNENVCFSGLQRRAQLFSAGAFPNEIVGYTFEVDPKTAGKKFVLSAQGAGVDVDINFYMGMGSLDDPAGAPAVIAYEERAEGGEKGVVPKGYSHAILCTYSGNNASFSYMAGAGVK